MPDDPNKRGKQDRARVSKQPHEQRYQAEKRKAAATTKASGKKKN